MAARLTSKVYCLAILLVLIADLCQVDIFGVWLTSNERPRKGLIEILVRRELVLPKTSRSGRR